MQALPVSAQFRIEETPEGLRKIEGSMAVEDLAVHEKGMRQRCWNGQLAGRQMKVMTPGKRMIGGQSMTRGSFRQADIERLIRAAEKTGAAVQVDLKTYVVTIFPGAGAAPKPAPPLQLPQVSDGKENWDDRDWADYRPYQSADAPPPPIQPELNYREFEAMIQLAKLGVGERLHPAGTRGFGSGTQKKLADRGYIEIIHEPGQKASDDEVCLTKKGLDDWQAQKAYVNKYPSL